MALTDGLISYWKLDETSDGSGAVTRVDSHGSNDLTDNNTTASAAGKILNAADFVGANSESLGRAGSITSAGVSRSVSLWARPDTTGAARGVANANGNAVPLGIAPLWIMLQRATNVWAVYHGGAYRDSATPAVVAGTWYHLVYTYHVADTAAKLYINAVERVAVTAVDTQTGVTTYLGAGFGGHFDGLVDECGIWSRAITPAEVTSLYNAGDGLGFPFPGSTPRSGFSNAIRIGI